MLNPHRPDGEHGSFSINGESGVWADFAEEEITGGDVVSLVAYVKGSSQSNAAQLTDLFLRGLSAGDPDQSAVVKPLSQPNTSRQPAAPAKSPALPGEMLPSPRILLGKGVPVVYRYNDADGLPIAVVCRYPGKDFRQQALVRTPHGRLEWAGEAPSPPRPLYGLDKLAARPEADVLVCEGEKAADAGGVLFPGMVVITTSGGANSPGKCDFSPLVGRKVFISPDNDEAGERYKDAVIDLVRLAGATPVSVLRFRREHFGAGGGGEAREVPKGYDLADALEEGWTADRLTALGTALWDDVTPGSPRSHSPVSASESRRPSPQQTEKTSQMELCRTFVQTRFGGRLLHDGSSFRTYRDGYWAALGQQVC